MIEAKISGLEIDLQLARNKLSDTELRAPFSGVVSEKYYDNHESVLPGAAILTLVDDGSFEGDLSVTEEFVSRQKSLGAVSCRFDAAPDRVFSARLKEISTTVQKGNRSYLATIIVDASAQDGLLLGMVGMATFEMRDRSGLIWIPASALIPGERVEENPSDTATWLVDPETLVLERRGIRVGQFEDDRVEVLEGLTGGETIVAAGARFLKDGQKVRLPATE